MSFFGPRKCPHCGMPVPSDALACHYCRQTVPVSIRWNFGSLIIGAALLFVLVSTFGSDNLFGSRVAQALQGFIPCRGNY
jgi:hypothetical protein